VPALNASVGELLVAHCVRHRAIDELVLASVRRDGFRQVVVLGAGYDMRASRFAAELEGVRWIEIDDPHTQTRKWRRLAGAPGVRPVRYVSTDFEAEPLSAPLARAGVDPESPTCFVLEGLVHYLGAATLASVLACLGRGPARVLLTYIEPEMRRSATSTITGLFRAVGEVPRFFPTPEALASLLAEHGLGRIRSWSFAEQVQQFVPRGSVAGRPLETRWWQTVVQADPPGGHSRARSS
jgi:methyltransferase (TIGR00027 family)